ncbi:MAG: hypothetical protein AAGN46_00855 [Acidobacteriota bacterium]
MSQSQSRESALSQKLQQLDQKVTGRVEGLIDGFREQLGDRVRQASDEIIQWMDEHRPAVPGPLVEPEALDDLALQHRALDETLAAMRRIDGETGQPEILDALLEESRRFASRSAFFLLRGDQLRGWGSRGFGDRRGAIENFDSAIDASPAAAAWRALNEGLTPLEDDQHLEFVRRLDLEPAARAILVPFVVRGQVAGALYADRLEGDGMLDAKSLQILVYTATQALETSAVSPGISAALRVRGDGLRPIAPPVADLAGAEPVDDTSAGAADHPVVSDPVADDPMAGAELLAEPEPVAGDEDQRDESRDNEGQSSGALGAAIGAVGAAAAAGAALAFGGDDEETAQEASAQDDDASEDAAAEAMDEVVETESLDGGYVAFDTDDASEPLEPPATSFDEAPADVGFEAIETEPELAGDGFADEPAIDESPIADAQDLPTESIDAGPLPSESFPSEAFTAEPLPADPASVDPVPSGFAFGGDAQAAGDTEQITSDFSGFETAQTEVVADPPVDDSLWADDGLDVPSVATEADPGFAAEPAPGFGTEATDGSSQAWELEDEEDATAVPVELGTELSPAPPEPAPVEPLAPESFSPEPLPVEPAPTEPRPLELEPPAFESPLVEEDPFEPPAPPPVEPAVEDVSIPAVGQQTVRLDVAHLQNLASEDPTLIGSTMPTEAPDLTGFAGSAPPPPEPEPLAPEPPAAEPLSVDPPAPGPADPPVAELPVAELPIPEPPAYPTSFAEPPSPEPAPEPPAPVGADAGSTQVLPPSDLEGPGLAFARSEPPAVESPSVDDQALHDEARRLARLLVSEIKLYNEEVIETGRRHGDIYDRLREDIDRSRQMYEERIDPRLQQSEDYFYQELVQRLAGGDERLLGM